MSEMHEVAIQPGWYASLIACQICTNEQVGVYPEGTDESTLQCGSCGARDSRIVERYGPDKKLYLVDEGG